MNVWPIASVDEAPHATLESWAAYEVQIASYDKPTRHLVGYAVQAREGRVTSAIVEVDAVARTVRTVSGRRYLLRGRPSRDPDADYVWHHWLHINDATVLSEVTDQLLAGESGARIDGERP